MKSDHSYPDRCTDSTTVITAWEDYRPPANPEHWRTIYNLTTGEPCPKCGVAIGVVFGPELEPFANEAMADYPVDVPEGFTDSYDVPVYLYCDAPHCTYQAVAEWHEIYPALDIWMKRDAPAWRDYVDAAGMEVTLEG